MVLWACTAWADDPQIEIEFTLTSSLVSSTGLLAIPPDGTIDTGSVTLTVPATEQASAEEGPATLSGLSLSLTTDASLFLAALSGPFAAVQQGSSEGDLNASLDEVVLSDDLFLDRSGTISCSGLFCWLFGDGFPLMFAGVEAIPAPLSIEVADIDDFGNATLSATVATTVDSGTAVFELLGEEQSRTFLPEPAGNALAIAACAALTSLHCARTRLARTAGSG